MSLDRNRFGDRLTLKTAYVGKRPRARIHPQPIYLARSFKKSGAFAVGNTMVLAGLVFPPKASKGAVTNDEWKSNHADRSKDSAGAAGGACRGRSSIPATGAGRTGCRGVLPDRAERRSQYV